jgi:DHA2 family multidrug resistance protein
MNAAAQSPAPVSKTTVRDWIAIWGALLGAFMAVLDIQITNASLKDIQGGIAASLDDFAPARDSPGAS